jgi:hypothetical protein
MNPDSRKVGKCAGEVEKKVQQDTDWRRVETNLVRYQLLLQGKLYTSI